MGVYASDRYKQSLLPGQEITLFSAEQPAAGVADGSSCSFSVAIPRSPNGALAGLNVELHFSAAPGAFQVDVQGANDDVNANFTLITGANVTAVDAVTFNARSDISTSAGFVRFFIKSRTNAVNLTARLRRA